MNELERISTKELMGEIASRCSSGVIYIRPKAQKTTGGDLSVYWGLLNEARGMCLAMSDEIGKEISER